jgi:V8-like Glu-specific endopeptidase
MKLGIIEQLTHSTVRLECTLNNGDVSCGTGFFVNFLQTSDECVPAIVTNKHVIAGSVRGRFNLTIANEEYMPILGRHEQIEFTNFETKWIKHPDPDIDLAVFPIGPLLNEAKSQNINFFYVPLRTELIPPEAERADLSSMEDVVMIGYPNGIWDSTNNLPVIRKGISATHPNTKWNGKQVFLTDIASFPGSSGSPVFLANIGGYMDKRGNVYMGKSRIRLLGVHYAGAMHTATGEIRIITAPCGTRPLPVTQIPNNIGVVISSSKLLDFEPILRKLMGLA